MKGMKWTRGILSVLISAALLLEVRAQDAPAKAAPEPQKTAVQQFKNIQVLKEIPADQLIPSMQFMAASLGVNCEFCHIEHAMDKDDKKPKQTARKMITMMMVIDQVNFNGEREVSCYTCHRGAARPVAIPVLSAEPSRSAAAAHREEVDAQECACG
jgi:photosynthetic reaction center cytochrome c subunit